MIVVRCVVPYISTINIDICLMTTIIDNDGQLCSSDELCRMVQALLPHVFDETGLLVHAFGYGSGVLAQPQQQPQQPQQPQLESVQVDVILVVSDADAFHRVNMQHNPHHYTSG